MYNLIKHSSTYSVTTDNLQIYFKDEATNFNTNTTNVDSFKSFEYKAKSLRNTVGQSAPKCCKRNSRKSDNHCTKITK